MKLCCPKQQPWDFPGSQVFKIPCFQGAQSLVGELRSQMPQGAAEENKIVATAHMQLFKFELKLNKISPSVSLALCQCSIASVASGYYTEQCRFKQKEKISSHEKCLLTQTVYFIQILEFNAIVGKNEVSLLTDRKDVYNLVYFV